MTTDTPPAADTEGSEGRVAPEPSAMPPGDRPRTVVVLVSASWAGPSRPAPTVLRELSRRWGGEPAALLIEDPADALLESWQVEHLPTWLAFRRVPDRQTPSAAGDRIEAADRTKARDRTEAKDRTGSWDQRGDGPAQATDDAAPGSPEGADTPAAAVGEPHAGTSTGSGVPLVLTGLEGTTPTGERLSLPGRWQMVRRRSGALPKHVVEAEFGPAST